MVFALFARSSKHSGHRGQPRLRGRARFSPAPAGARNGTSRGGDCGRRTFEGWGRRRRQPWLPLVAVGARVIQRPGQAEAAAAAAEEEEEKKKEGTAVRARAPAVARARGRSARR